MNFVSLFRSDGSPGCDRARMVFWLRLAGALTLLALVYAYGLHLRLLDWPAWQHSGLSLRGEWLLPTNDAYFELVAADGGRGFEPPSPLARLLALLHALTSISLGTLAFWIPAFVAPLASLPPMILFLRWNMPATALLTGVLAASCTTYVARTRLGYFDTDMVNVFFPLLIASLLAAWARMSAEAEKTSIRWRELLGPDGLFVLAGVGIGLVAWCWGAVYSSGRNLTVLILIASFPVIVWTQRQRLFPAMVGLALMLAVMFKPAWGLLGSLLVLPAVLLVLRRFRVRTLSGQLAWTVAALLCLGLGGIAIWKLWPTISHHLQGYGIVDTPFGENTVSAGIHIPNSYAMVSEVQRPPQEILWQFFVPSPTAMYALLGMALLGLCVQPVLLPLLPLALLSLSIPWFGARFAVYGPALAVLAGAGLSLLEGGRIFGTTTVSAATSDAVPEPSGWLGRWRQRWLLLRKRLKRLVWLAFRILLRMLAWGLAIGGSLWLAAPTESMLANSIAPASILTRPLARQLTTLDAKLPAGAVIWCWWDYGFNIQYHARRHTIADSRSNGFTSIFVPGFAMTADDPLQTSRLMRFAASQMHARPLNKQVPQHVSYENYTMDTLRAMGHEKATAFLESLRHEEPAPTPGAPEQFVLVSWEGLAHMYHMAAVGKWNLRSGGSPKYYLLPLDNVRYMEEDGNKVTFGRHAPQELDGYSVIDASGNVRHVKLNAGNNLYAIWNQHLGAVYLLHRDMYNSTYVRLLMWNKNGPPVPGFKLIDDASPVMRVFQSVP